MTRSRWRVPLAQALAASEWRAQPAGQARVAGRWSELERNVWVALGLLDIVCRYDWPEVCGVRLVGLGVPDRADGPPPESGGGGLPDLDFGR